MTGRRLRQLENVVNGFRIAGDGLTGGFPASGLRIDKVYTHGERVDDLERRTNGFTLRGRNGVRVAGSMKTGFIVSAEGESGDGAGAAGSGGNDEIMGCTNPAATNYDPAATVDDGSCTYTCAANLQMQVDISGVSLCLGCLTVDTFIEVDDISLNGTFTLDRFSDESTCTWEGSGGSFIRRTYSDVDCTALVDEQTVGTLLTVNYLTYEGIAPGGWQIRLLWESGLEILFQATVPNLDSANPNEIDCLTPPVGPGYFPIASGGVITCTLL